MKQISLACPINQTGYGIASFNILKELSKVCHINYFPIGNPMVSNQEEYTLVQNLFTNQETANIESPFIKIWHQFDLGTHFGRGKYFGFPFFELDTFNTREKQHLSVPDTIFVTSEWARNVIKNNDINSDIEVIPLGVDTTIFDHDKYTAPKNNNKYIFLNIGKWEVRKGHDILYKIFADAFPKENDVELWILASEITNNYSTPEQLAEWKKLYGNDKRIRVFTGVQKHEEIAEIMHTADCGIFPSRAEGWNLELLEMMAMNKPVIATDYSSHTEFCNKDNSFLIDINDTELAKDGKAFYGQGNWAKIGQSQIDQTIEHMRYVYKNRIIDNINGLKTAETLSWKNSADKILRCIDK